MPGTYREWMTARIKAKTCRTAMKNSEINVRNKNPT